MTIFEYLKSGSSEIAEKKALIGVIQHTGGSLPSRGKYAGKDVAG